MKRKAVVTIIFVIIIIMLLQTSAFAFTYTDVPITHWSYVPIDRVTDLGIMTGISSTVFGRNDELKRKEAAQILTLLAQKMWRNEDEAFAYVGTNTGFTDVPSSSAYAKYVAWVKDKGIMSGVSETAFNPDVTINRQEICVSLYKLKQYLGTPFETIEYDYYYDHDDISSWATGGVYALTRFGVVTGDNYGNFTPKDPIERQEMAAIVYAYRTLSRYKRNITTPVPEALAAQFSKKENEYNSLSAAERYYYEMIQDNGYSYATLYISEMSTAIITARTLGYNVSADMLEHYAEASGTTYTVNLLSMLNGTSTAQYDLYRNEVNDYRKAVETYIDGNTLLALRDEIRAGVSNFTGNDWKYSINKCRYVSQISANKSSSYINAIAYYRLRDFYDYESDGYGFLDVAAFGLDVLNKLGYARCYYVNGAIETGGWNVGDRLY